MQAHLRVARPVTDLAAAVKQYTAGLDLSLLGRFEDHNGFDGAMVGRAGGHYHFEFTVCHHHPQRPSPTPEDLLVFYIASETQWRQACARMLAAGFIQVAPLNPYWAQRGCTFQDHDGYCTVLQNAAWS